MPRLHSANTFYAVRENWTVPGKREKHGYDQNINHAIDRLTYRHNKLSSDHIYHRIHYYTSLFTLCTSDSCCNL